LGNPSYFLEPTSLNNEDLFGRLSEHVFLFRQIDFAHDIWRSPKGEIMSNEKNNRVLTRMGARQLTKNEIDQVAAAKLTFATALVTGPVNNPDDSFDQ
jgi:hypothetical protein